MARQSSHQDEQQESTTPTAATPPRRGLFSRSHPSALLADLAPHILQPAILASPHFNTRGGSVPAAVGSTSSSLRSRLGLGWGAASKLQDSNSLYIREKVDDLLRMEVPPAPFDFRSAMGVGASSGASPAQARIEWPAPDAQVPLIRGFQATNPAARNARLERRRKRAGLGEQALGLEQGSRLGLRERGDRARGLLGSVQEDGDGDGQDTLSDLGVNRRASTLPKRRKRAGRKSELLTGGSLGRGQAPVLEELPELSLPELQGDAKAVETDMANVAVRRALLNSQIAEVDTKMAALEAIREGLKRGLLSLREEELELEDELEGIQERIQTQSQGDMGGQRAVSTSSRRRKGPAFLPSEHDDLPPNVAFMTLTGHLAPITALDFSEPYGTAVTASYDQSVRLWDLTTGDEMGYLKGHRGTVKVLQVESSVCVTGGQDGQIRIWDLDVAEAAFAAGPGALQSPTSGVTSSLENVFLGRNSDPMDDLFNAGGSGGAGLVNGDLGDDGLMREQARAATAAEDESGPCVKTLDGHSKAVTSLYFDGSCLVTGSNDSTLRQWDLQTGQCVLTMDILWAISNTAQTVDPPDDMDNSAAYSTPATSPRKSRSGLLRRQSSNFLGGSPGGPGFASSPTTTTYADGSWEMYDDFVGGVQFWGYALASGTSDGCVRMWDMRTGQAHRTLVGHTAPVTCVQFDEFHLVSGSLDKSIRIWDLRTGAISDTIRYEHPITGLQFDSRKIVAAAGENGVRVFNRTTLQHTSLTINGHTSPVERLRFMDSYLSSGGRDNTVKVWRL